MVSKMSITDVVNMVAQLGPVTVMALYAMRIMETTIKANTEAINKLAAKMEEHDGK